jgi:uncharacterized Ntn-hydrolase superfamily protein
MKSYLNSFIFLLLFFLSADNAFPQQEEYLPVSTFSIVARDPETGEIGIAVASRFFAVGSVVPWAKANVGGIATQSFANTSFGWRGLELLQNGESPESTLKKLLENDDNPDNRQVGIVSADGKSVIYTGSKCISWAGGHNGENYAIQGNILTGENVVVEMEKKFLEAKGSLADRLYAVLIEGDRQGGDSRGKQSAAMLVVKDKAGYGGYTDRAIDIRVDDHPEPFIELGRLLEYAKMNYYWNEAWTLYTNKEYAGALPLMKQTAELAPENPEVLYDLVVIETSAGEYDAAIAVLRKTLQLNPKLKQQAKNDKALDSLRDNKDFQSLIE